MTAPLLQLQGVSKYFGGVTALQDVDFACQRHSIHAVLGENGAGKSTLIKIIAGVLRPDTGHLLVDGEPAAFDGPRDAMARGIVCVFQELSLVPDLSVAANIFVTNPPRRFGMIDQREQRRQAEALLARMGCEEIDPRARCADLPLTTRQLVEIAKAVGREPTLLILDEATSALTARDVEKVFAILRRLREDGLGLLYISHRMPEIEALADTASVFRNGERIETFGQGARTPGAIVQMMIGRSIEQVYPARPEQVGREPILSVRGLGWTDRLRDISFDVGQGEIVGLGGLEGQGQRELLLALFGVMRHVTGDIRIGQSAGGLAGPAEAKRPGIGVALIPEDRKSDGVILPMSVRDNLGLAVLDTLSRGGIIDRGAESREVGEMISTLQIRASSTAVAVRTLSGGNQQKVVLGKWLLTRPKLLLLMDPTRGIDVGTKQEIYRLLRELADRGTGLLFYTTDHDELVGMCDRVMIMYQGGITRVLEGAEIDEHTIVASSLNIEAKAAA